MMGHEMIRKSTVLIIVAAVLSACASGKVNKRQQGFAPANFVITDVTVDIEADPRPNSSFVQLTRSAAENLRQAYNREITSTSNSYTVEFSVQDVKVTQQGGLFEPITSNSVSLIATLRHPDNGIALREMPVTYQLVQESETETKEEQLLRGALPRAFNGLYGIESTPQAVQSVVNSNQIFDGLNPAPSVFGQSSGGVSQPVYLPRNTQAPEASQSSSNAGEPTVIECAIC